MITLILTCSCVLVAHADQDSVQGRRRGFDPARFSVLRPLREETVLKLLQLTDNQTNQIEGILKAWDETFEAYLGLPTEKQDRGALKEQLDERVNQVLDVLGREKISRLGRFQVAMGAIGVSFNLLRSELYASDLALKPEQIALINEQYQATLEKLEKELRKTKSSDRHPMVQLMLLKPTVKILEAEAMKAIGEQLTQEQRERLQQLDLQTEAALLGAEVFQQPHVIEALLVTNEQKVEFAQIVEDLKGQRQGYMSAHRKGYLDAANILSDKQWEKWREILGSPVTPLEHWVWKRGME